MQSFPIVIAAVVVLMLATPVSAATNTVVPVIWQSPACAHDKLGQVSIRVGTRVTESTQDVMVPTVDYDWAFAKLAAAAKAQGANAVVVRWHQATYFTRNSRRSHKPVHVQLRGAAIRTHAESGPCSFALADAGDFEQRARRGEPVEVGSDEAYGD